MHTPKKSSKSLASMLAIALVLSAAPEVFAKKDLFGNEPGAKQPEHVEQLAPHTSSSATADASASPATAENLAQTEKEPTEAKAIKPRADESPSYLAQQFDRLKLNLAKAKDDLFGNNKSRKKEAARSQRSAATQTSEQASSSEGAEIPTISTAEAAQRAQSLVEGQVINVRKYQEDDKPRYAVKLLQKNGRMKTINLDAVSGELIEEAPQ